MRHLFLFAVVGALAACGATHPAVVWSAQGTGETTTITIDNHGVGQFTATVDGVLDDDEQLAFTKGQLHELVELYRSHGVCEMSHDPAYKPVENEGQTTVKLDAEDLHCEITLYDLEWQKKAKDIVETMRSMRPLNNHKQKAPRKLDPKGMSQ